MISLLKVDNKLIIVNSLQLIITSITDNLPGQVIRKIIFNDTRFVILTTTKLYYVYNNNGYNFVDITNNIKQVIDIDNITFITNSYYNYGYQSFSIFTNLGDVLYYEVNNHVMRITRPLFTTGNENVVAISNEGVGYIHIHNNKYHVKRFSWLSDVYQICTLNKLPKMFPTSTTVLCNNKLVEHNPGVSRTIDDDICHMYNNQCYAKNGDIYEVVSGGHTKLHHWTKCKTVNHKVINVKGTFVIVIDTSKSLPNIIEHYGNLPGIPVITRIGESYYCTKNFAQYSNDTWNIVWSPTNHKLYDKYSTKIVKLVLVCYKYSKFRKFMSKGVLHMVLQFVLFG